MANDFNFCPRCAKPLGPRHDGGAARLACPDVACGFVHYDNPVPVVAGVVEHEGKVLLVRNKGWPESWFGLVTGFLEKGETPERGMIRELGEELGLEGRIASFIGHYDFAMMNQLIVAYHVVATGTLALGDELSAYKAIAPEKVRPWELGTGQALKDWLARRGGGDG